MQLVKFVHSIMFCPLALYSNFSSLREDLSGKRRHEVFFPVDMKDFFLYFLPPDTKKDGQ